MIIPFILSEATSDSVNDQMDASTASETMQEATTVAASIGAIDVAILLSLCGLGAYWLLFRKSKSNEFDASSIKTFAIESTSLARNGSISESGFIAKMKASGRNIVVFYGSQTGTAEEFAARLAKEANRFGMKAMVADPEECDMEDLSKLTEIENSLAVFCLATYGEGDPTDNAQDLHEWLQNGSADLTGVKYAVFGLGNKTYEHFNKMGKYADTRLAEMGATRICELGMGDDDENIEDDFITWKEQFWNAVREHFNITSFGEDVSMRQYELIVHDEETLDKSKVFTGEIARLKSYETQKPPFDAKNPFMAKVVVNRELYKGSRSCMHIELDITGSKIRYEAGDHVAVYPMNDEQLVEKIGKLLNVNLETVITLKNLDEDSSKKHPFPCPTSYRTALLYYLDITSHPRTHILKELSEYCSDEKDKQLLKQMSSSTPEGKQLYHDWVVKSCRNIVQILEDLPSCKPPLDHLLELMPRLQCRYYSISSSPKLHPNTIHITAVNVEYETPLGRINRGVCTSWLKKMNPSNNNEDGPRIPVFVRRSQFRLPTKPQTPVIMIGPGTGLAPFRGFLQERAFLKEEGKPVGENILYFGCRKRTEDFLYQEELEKYESEGVLTKLYLAFSRDQAQKVYVTHMMRQNEAEIWSIIGEKNGHIYVCG